MKTECYRIRRTGGGRSVHTPNTERVQPGCSMTARKIDWSLTPAERELLRRDCEASKVPIAVEAPDAIKKVVALITKARGRRDAA